MRRQENYEYRLRRLERKIDVLQNTVEDEGYLGDTGLVSIGYLSDSGTYNDNEFWDDGAFTDMEFWAGLYERLFTFRVLILVHVNEILCVCC